MHWNFLLKIKVLISQEDNVYSAIYDKVVTQHQAAVQFISSYKDS